MRYQFGSYQLDDQAFELSSGGQPIALEPKALQLLLYCVQHAGRLLRKQELLDQIWTDANVGENALTRCVAQVRKALNEDSRDPRYIATVPTVGYRFLADVSIITVSATPEVPTSSAALRSGFGSEAENKSSTSIRRLPLAVGLIAAGVVLLAVTGWLGWLRYEDHVGGPPVKIVLADFDGGTGDLVLDRTLQDVLRFELLQSPFVAVVTPGAIRSLMTQMRHDPSELLTPELARDICERTGSQAVLRGSLARLGNRFVMTEEVTSCADNATIGTAKQSVTAIEDLPAAEGKMAATLRHDMGESRRTIARFNKPLSPENTNSIEALKAFSQAGYLNNMGKYAEAVDLLKRAVALDPKFAAAYFNLWDFSFNTADAAERKSYLQKAFDLRKFATEPTRLAITTYYEQGSTGDMDALLQNLRTWADAYPRDPSPWTGLAEISAMLGKYQESITATRHVLQLDPDNSLSYYMLAKVQMQADDYAGARKTCELALAKGIDTELIRVTLLGLGHVTHDAELIAQQDQWAKAHAPSPHILLDEAYMALADGRAHAADTLFLLAEDAYRQQGDATLGMHYRQGSASAYFGTGWPEKARAQLKIAPITYNFNLPDDLVALAETGKPELAESMLQEQLAKRPRSTRWNRLFAPHLRATIDLLNHRPADALAVMAALNGTELDDMAYTRGLAYLQLNQLTQAEAQFRKLIDHPGVDPTSYEVPLAQLQMARVLAREGRKDDAVHQYQVFLTSWKDADKDSTTLKAAQAELSSLRSSRA